MQSSTDINVEKVSVKMSINQIVSFLSMINNTSRILSEKYIERIKNDDEMDMGRGKIHSSIQKKNASSHNSEAIDTNKFKETYDIFSTRYGAMPMKKQGSVAYQCEDETDELDALASKSENISKLRSPIKLAKNPNLEEEKKEIPEEISKIESTRLAFFFEGLSIFFINDHKDNFYPVL